MIRVRKAIYRLEQECRNRRLHRFLELTEVYLLVLAWGILALGLGALINP